jgi:putative transposase
VILDIYSRYVVGWMIAHRESAELAEQLIADTVSLRRKVRAVTTICVPKRGDANALW